MQFQVRTKCQSQTIKLEPRSPVNKSGFWSNPHKIEVMITFLIEMLQTLVTLPHLWYNLNQGIKFFGDVIDRNYDVITFFQNTLILRRPGVAIFAGIIKNVTMFIKIFTQDSRKTKRIINYDSKSSLYLYFLV